MSGPVPTGRVIITGKPARDFGENSLEGIVKHGYHGYYYVDLLGPYVGLTGKARSFRFLLFLLTFSCIVHARRSELTMVPVATMVPAPEPKEDEESAQSSATTPSPVYIDMSTALGIILSPPTLVEFEAASLLLLLKSSNQD